MMFEMPFNFTGIILRHSKQSTAGIAFSYARQSLASECQTLELILFVTTFESLTHLQQLIYWSEYVKLTNVNSILFICFRNMFFHLIELKCIKSALRCIFHIFESFLSIKSDGWIENGSTNQNANKLKTHRWIWKRLYAKVPSFSKFFMVKRYETKSW